MSASALLILGMLCAPAAYFDSVHPQLVRDCKACHSAGGPAAGTFALVGELKADFRAVRPFAPRLVQRAGGDGHRKIWAPDSAEATRLKAWLDAGAQLSAGATGFTGVVFKAAVHDKLIEDCQRCHRAGGLGEGAFVLVGDLAGDYSGLKPLAPVILQRARGEGHPQIWSSAAESTLIESWLKDGARSGAERSPAPVEVAVAPPPVEAPVETGAAGFAEIDALLRRKCIVCHAPGSPADFVVAATPAELFATASRFVVPGAPEESPLFLRPTGNEHATVLEAGEAALLKAWILAGAQGPEVEERPASMPASKPALVVDKAEPVATPVETPTETPAPPLVLPPMLTSLLDGVSLHGRFDLNYERRGYTDNPLAEGGRDALRSYHHFLFLGRHTDKDAFGLDVEITSLQFWELSYRFTEPGAPARVTAHIGKLFVPFGAPPSFHQSYGGLVGFDQRVLPAVWTQEGARVSARGRVGPVGLLGDVFVLSGYGLDNADDTLNLQADLSPLDDVQPALGSRVGASWGPVAAWYSMMLDPLAEDRLLYLQAADVSFARWRGVPVLEYLSAAAGVLRADVSGGGPGKDHYHFATYFQLRAYPLDWLTLQYRQGLRTFDNRGGLFFDERRADSKDGSTHSISAVATWQGISAGVSHQWNLEKVDEIDDDLLRVTVSYDF